MCGGVCVSDGRDPDPNPDLRDIFSPNPDPDIGIFLCQSRYILPRITKGLDDIEDILKVAKTLGTVNEMEEVTSTNNNSQLSAPLSPRSKLKKKLQKKSNVFVSSIEKEV